MPISRFLPPNVQTAHLPFSTMLKRCHARHTRRNALIMMHLLDSGEPRLPEWLRLQVLTSIISSCTRAKVRRRRSCRRFARMPCAMHPVEPYAVDTRRSDARASARSDFLTYVRRRCRMPVMPGDGKSRSWVHPFVALRVCLPPSPSTSQRLRRFSRGGNAQQKTNHRKVDQCR